MNSIRTFRSFAAIAAFLALSISAAAAPFAKWLRVPVPGGGTVEIWGEGDEYDAWFETKDGHALRVNDDAGRYEYVDLDETTGGFVGTGIFLGDEAGNEARLAALPRGIRDTSEAHRRAVEERIAEMQKVLRDDERWEEAKKRGAERIEMLEKAAAGKADPDSPEYTHATSGRYVGVTILVDFPLLDASGNVTNSLSKTISTKYNVDAVDAMMNGENYTTDGSIASMHDYWATVSDGAVDYNNVVIDWVMAPHPREYYNDTSSSSGTCGRKLIGDVLETMAADPDFDTKYLPKLQQATLSGRAAHALNVIYAGPDSGTWSKGLWPHRWTLTSTQYSKMYWTMPNGTQAYFYDYEITKAANSLYNDTLLHENGHMICGFPDLYAASHSDGTGVGGWCLMCYHNTGPAVCAPLRVGAGWATPKTLPAQGWVTVTSDRTDVWKFANPNNSREFFMIENRQKKGLDKGLNGSGVLIWRADESYSNNQYPSSTIRSNFTGHPATNRWAQYLSLEQADGEYDNERGSGYYGDSTDPWYAGNRGSLFTGVFNYDSAACSRWKDGSDSGLKLSHFSASGDTMTFFVGDPSTWPEPFVEIKLKSVGGEAATFTALVESWGSGASSADVYAEIGSDAAFSTVVSSTKIGTMTQLNRDTDWQVGDLEIGTPHYVRIKLKNAAGEFVGPVATLDYQRDENIPPAVDAPRVLFWQSPGNPKNWFVATDKTHKGATSAKSGAITHNQTTVLNATVTGPGTFSFWWNVSSESVTYDWHAYTTSWNPATTNKIGGTSATWAQVTLQVPAGSQTISWSYRKDGSQNSGSDCAWLDDVVWRADAAEPIVTAADAGNAGVSTIDVDWTLENLSTGATSCNLFLEYSTSSSFPSASTTTVPIGSATDEASGTWTLTGLAAGTTYYIRAKAVSDTDKTGYSEAFSAATANPALPDFTFAATASETPTRGVVSIDVSGFGTGASSGTATIEYSTTPDFAGAKTATASLTRTGATAVELTRLSAGTTYYVRVTVLNNQNKSFTRGPKTFTTADPGFYQPGLAQVRYGCTSSSYPDFTVTVADNASTYAIERTPGPIMADITGSSCSTVNPYTATTWAWANNTTYYYEGEMFFKGGVTYNFFHCIDDGAAIELDGEWLTRQTASNESGYNKGVLKASKSYASDGWHAVRIWVYDWSGGKGYVSGKIGFSGIGIGWNTNGCTTVNAANQSNWSTLRDPGDASLLRTLSGAELPSFVTLDDDLMIAGTTLTGTIHTDGIEDGCTVTLYAGQSNAGSNTVGWAQSFVAGTVPSESYNLPFQWDDFCDAGDVAGWFVIARMTNPSGSYEGWSVVREPHAGNIFVVGIQEGASGLNTISATPRVVGFGEGAQSASVCLEYSTDANFANAQTTANVTATTTNWLSAVTISGLAPNTVYYVRTKGVKNGETVYSRKATLSTLDYGTPVATVSVGTTTLTSIPVTWTVSSLGLGNSSAEVWLDYGTSTSYGSSVKVATVTTSQVPKSGSWTLSDLPGETTYYVRVRVVASPSGKSGTSAGASGQTKPVGNPVVSATLGAVAQYTATFSYNLTALGDGAASATLYYDVSTSSTFPSGSTTSTTIQGGILPGSLPKVGTATVTGLDAETTYYLRVRAVNHAGKSGVSTTMTVNTTAVGDPEVAVDMTSVLQRAATASISIATLGEAAESATVTVEYGTSTSYGSTAAVTGTPAAGAVLTAAFENLATETTYYVRVTVRNDAGKTGVATTSFRTLEPNDPAFTYTVTPSYTAASFALDVTKIGNGASSASGYVRWGTSASLSPELGRAALSKIVAPGPMSGAATGLTAGTTYYYEVVVTNNLAGLTAKTGSFKTETAGDLAYGTGYWDGGLLQGYCKGLNNEQWGLPVNKSSAEAARWNSSGYVASFAYGAVASYQVLSTSNWTNPYDGATYPMDKWNRMWAYGGQMWMEAGVKYWFAVNFYHAAAISIDGTVVVSEDNGGNGTPNVGSVTPETTGWHDIAVAVGSDGNGAGAANNPWNHGSPFETLRYGTAWNTNNLSSVTSSNASQWKQLLDAGDRHLFRARGNKAPMAFLDQDAAWTANSVTVPVRLDTMYDNLTLTVYASRSPNAWYFEDRWEKKVVVGSTGTAGAKTLDALFTGIDATVDWYVSVRLSDGANYDYWSDPVKFTPQIVRQPPAGNVTVGTPTFTSNTATVNVTSLGDETGTVAVVLEYSTDASFTTPVSKTGTAVSAPGAQDFSLTGLQPGRTYYVRARLTGSALHLETLTDAVSFTTPAYTAPTIGSVTAASAGSTSGTVSVNVTSLGQGSSSATVEVYVSTGAFGTTPNATRTIAATGVQTFAITGLQAGTAYFVKVVVAGSNGKSATVSDKSFVTGDVESTAWFDVKWSSQGWGSGAAWRTSAGEAAAGGAWSVPSGDASSRSGSLLALGLPDGGVLRFTARTPSASKATVKVEGAFTPVLDSAPPDPGNAIAGLCFARGGYKAWNGTQWVALSGASPAAASTAWTATFDWSQATPRVRYVVGGTALKASGSEWIPLATSQSCVTGVGYAGGGSIGDFKAGYTGGGYVAPVLSTLEDGGHVPLAFGKDSSNNPTFEITIKNAVKDAWYTVYAADAVTGPYKAVTSEKATAGGLKTLSIPAPSSKPARFVRIGVSDAQISANTEL